MYEKNTMQPSHFRLIKDYVKHHDIKLLILDFNGVLDDSYARKERLLIDVLGGDSHHLPNLMVFIDKLYSENKSVTLSEAIETYFLKSIGSTLTDEQYKIIDSFKVSCRLTQAAKDFLGSLDLRFVIYTALSTSQIADALDGDMGYEFFTRDQQSEPKPSVINLLDITKKYGVDPCEVCVVGDGLLDDTMPAALIGMHTFLVTPYASRLINPEIS